MASYMLNDRLNKFFADEVQLSRDESSRVVKKVLPEVREILSKVNGCDPRYRKDPDTVGSYYQGLKVEKADEFDFSVPFDIGSKLQWAGDSKPLYFGFNDPRQNDEATMNENLRIVPSHSPLKHPGPGYVSVQLTNDLHKLPDVQFLNYLIPFFVKLKFRQLLFQALNNNNNNAKRKDDLRLSRMIHGPALTMTMDADVGDSRGPLAVSIDFAVVVHAGLPFADFIGWPRRGCRWPSTDKIAAVREKGINVVTKKNFHWFLSFADLEKCLVRDVDRDGGCRKKVHRIMKTLYHKSNAAGKQLLSSYMLKNAWLWECESNPSAESWCGIRLGERFLGCIGRLRRFIEEGKLPQYFYPKIDLLKGKDVGKLRRIVDEIYCSD